MSAPYSPKSVANAFLNKSFAEKKPLGHMKIQKLVFLAHGYYLAYMNGVPLVNEPFEAWDYGPVCRSLYDEFKCFGRENITSLATDVDWDLGECIPVPPPDESDRDAQKVLNFVFKTYSPMSAFALSDLSHKEGFAWDKTRQRDIYKLRNKDIDNDLIKTDFEHYVRKKDGNQ